MGWKIGVLGFDSQRRLGIFLFTTVSRTVLGPTQPPIQWVPWALSLGVKRPGREADHSPPSSVEVKNGQVFMTWCFVRQRDNFTFASCPCTQVCGSTRTSLSYLKTRNKFHVKYFVSVLEAIISLRNLPYHFYNSVLKPQLISLSRVLLEELIVTQLVINYQHFMESSAQQPITGSYSESDKSSPQLPNLFL
jgi:hypothetical protein